MKKIIPGGIFAFTLLLFSCSKKQNSIHENVNSSASQNIIAERPAGGRPNATMYSDGWCRAFDLNCTVLPEVIITATGRTILSSVDNQEPITVAWAFNDENLKNLASQLPTDYLNKLLSGTYYITKGNESATSISYMAGTSYPLTFEKMEFAFQVSK